MMKKAKHAAYEIWNFFRAAGVLQAVVDGKAFRDLKNLPNENWAVLSCPTKGLNFDAKTLSFIDDNNDGHIRISEVLAAIDWVEKRISSMDGLLQSRDIVALKEFSETADGKALKTSAQALLKEIGKGDAAEISLADVLKRQSTFLVSEFNGDGVIVLQQEGSAEAKKLYGEMVATTGGAADRSGAKGVDKATIDAFYKACTDHLAWIEKGRSEAGQILPLGEGTARAVGALEAVRAKIDDYFHRCRLVAFDSVAEKALNSGEADYAAVALKGDLSSSSGDIAAFPIARVSDKGILSLSAGINPEWADRIRAFTEAVVVPILGENTESLSEKDWRELCAKFAAYISWNGAVGGACVASLGEARIREILSEEKVKNELIGLIEKDMACSSEISKLDDLEKFLRLHANLNRFLCNYLNFSDYYNPEAEEIYRAGRLYIDGRVCKECVYVDNMGAHSSLAAASKIFLAYCDIVRPQTGEKKTICAAVTAGFAASLWVGRNGLFYDAQGKDWNAVIVKIVECQISLKEAFWAPWLKISDLISEQIKKILSSKETAMMSVATTQVSGIGEKPAASVDGQKRDGAALASSVAAIGIAIGIIGSALGGLISAIKGVSVWQGILGVLAIVLVVSGPAVLLAWFRLRSRDFAPILNACGWAINKKMRMPMRLGRVFTYEAEVPEGSNIEMRDPYIQKHTVRNTFILILLAMIGGGVWVWRCHAEWIPSWVPSFLKPQIEQCEEKSGEAAVEAVCAEGEEKQVPAEEVEAP